MSRRFAILQAAVSLVALVAVVLWASHQEKPHVPGTLDAALWIAGGAALYAGVTLLRAERWHHILQRAAVSVPRSDAYGLTSVGYMGNNVLPARAGEMLRVVILSRRTGAGKRLLFGTVVAERLLDAVALTLIFLTLVYAVLRETTLPGNRPLVVGGMALAAALVTAAALVIGRRRGLLRRFRDFVRPLAGAPRALLSRHGLLLLSLSFVIWAVEAAVYLSVARAVELDLSAMGSLYLVALTNLFAMLPAAPGYVGTFDAAVVFGAKAIGAAGSLAVSYLLLLRFLLFVPITVFGLIVLVLRYGGWSRLRTAGLEASRA